LGPAATIKRPESEWFRYPGKWTGREAPNYNLLRVSKQVRAEALQAGWVGTWKHFKSDTVCYKVLTCAISPVTLNWLAKVELDFDFDQWFEFLGMAIGEPGFPQFSNPTAQHLGNIRTLKHLCLVFPHPSYAWGTMRQFARTEVFYNYIRAMEASACHREVVEWILTLIFPFVKDIPRVTLDLFIKTDQKERWEDILHTEYLQRNEDYRTHGYMHTEAMRNVLRSINTPPKCYCPLPCAKDEHEHIDDWGYIRRVFDFKDEFTPELHQRAVKVLRQAKKSSSDDEYEVSRRLIIFGQRRNLEFYERKYAAIEVGDSDDDSTADD
jgi:hypothetical protein